MLKYAVPVLCYPLSLIVNKFVINGELRDKIKIAIILLFPKAGLSNSINNWRPISILSVFSKLLKNLS